MNLAQEQPDPKAAGKETAGATSSFLAELRGGSGVDAGEPAASGSRIKLTGPTLVLLAVAGAGAALLVGMRQLGMKVASASQPVAIEYTPGEARAVSTKACQQIMSAIERGVPIQVPGDQLYKNPFLLQENKPAPDQPSDDPERDAKRLKELAEKAARERQAQIEQSLAVIKLLGVLGGKVPVARINTETVRVGDTVGEFFTVTAITGRSVTLQCEGKDHVITMEDPKQGKGGSPKPAPRQQR